MTLRRPPQTPKKAEFWGRFAQKLKCICCKEIVDFVMWETTVWTPFGQGISGGLRKPHFKSLYHKELQCLQSSPNDLTCFKGLRPIVTSFGRFPGEESK